MTKKFIAGGCSFTFGHELSDDQQGKTPSKKTWAHGLFKLAKDDDDTEYICVARAGSGNSGIARRVFQAVAHNDRIECVVVMWSFLSRYDWAMPRHKALEDTRWATISPWDANIDAKERHRALSGSEVQTEQWKIRQEAFTEANVKPFAESLYRHAANQYHETYLSWKSIIWLQNLLEKKKIPYMFTLADNSLFYQELTHHKEQDAFMNALHSEIDLTKWFWFGDRMMGFNQWATLNDYGYATTHPLDEAHADAVQLMLPTFEKITGGKR